MTFHSILGDAILESRGFLAFREGVHQHSGPPSPAREKLSAGLLLVNILLGVGVLLLTGLSVAFGSPLAA